MTNKFGELGDLREGLVSEILSLAGSCQRLQLTPEQLQITINQLRMVASQLEHNAGDLIGLMFCSLERVNRASAPDSELKIEMACFSYGHTVPLAASYISLGEGGEPALMQMYPFIAKYLTKQELATDSQPQPKGAYHGN